MLTKASVAKIRKLHIQSHLSINEISRRTSHSRNTVRTWIRDIDKTPVEYKRATREKLIDEFIPWLRQSLEADLPLPKRDRRTATMLFEEIQKQGFVGCYSRVTEFVLSWKLSKKEIPSKSTADMELLRWKNWIYEIEQACRSHEKTEQHEIFKMIYDVLYPSPNSPRIKALVILAKHDGFSEHHITKYLAISRNTTSRYLTAFTNGGEEGLFKGKERLRKSKNPNLQKCIFTLLHEPPSLHGYNRTTWRMDDLKKALNKYGYTACDSVIHEVIKAAGYRWRSAKVVLTSNDPDYREKYQHIQDILSALKDDERFFSIDEYGPFAIKMKAGRLLVEPNAQPTVPQWQKSKGWLILTAALELSKNQVTHFYSKAKNTKEMIRMTEVLLRQYQDMSKLYISWDAASWHISKELKKYIEEHNKNAELNNLPMVELAPLPASAQFLNVIESVFSGMARAIIHSSNYESTQAAMDAIDRHFKERNQHFLDMPKRAGNKIWGMERTSSEFTSSNNCKDPAYR